MRATGSVSAPRPPPPPSGCRGRCRSCKFMTSTVRAPGGRAPISPKTTSPSALAIPLHVGEAVAKAERAEHGVAHGAAAGEVVDDGVAQRQGDRADPLQRARDQRPRPVPGDVLVEDRPSAQMVSKVNSSPSTNSSTLTSAHSGERRQRPPRARAAVSTRWVCAEPAPAIGLTMTGKPMASAASRTPSAVAVLQVARGADARRRRGPLHHLLVAEGDRSASTVMPGTPSVSRSRAASSMVGSQSDSTWSTRTWAAHWSRTAPRMPCLVARRTAPASGQRGCRAPSLAARRRAGRRRR